MTRANTEQLKYTPWFAKAGAACSIVPIARFVNDRIFALKGGGYGCLFSLAGLDEEGLTDQELEAEMRSIEGALRGLPEGACLYQYARVMSGFNLPRKKHYANQVTQVSGTLRAEVDHFMQAMRTSQESEQRRKYERIEGAGTQVDLRRAEHGTASKKIIDISLGGAALACDWPCEAGTEIMLCLPGGGPEVSSRVVSVRGNVLAVAFRQDPQTLAHVAQAIDWITAKFPNAGRDLAA